MPQTTQNEFLSRVDILKWSESEDRFSGENGRFYIDPYDSNTAGGANILGRRLILEDKFHPIFTISGLRSSQILINWVVFLCLDDPSSLILWKMEGDSPGIHRKTSRISYRDLAATLNILTVNDEYLKEIVETSWIPLGDWRFQLCLNLQSIVHNAQSGDLDSNNQLVELNNLIINDVFGTYMLAVNSSLPDLIKELPTLTDSENAASIKALYDELDSDLGVGFDIGLASVARYTLLRELFCLVTGHHVLLCPFSLRHVKSVDCFLNDTKSRQIKYISADGRVYIEVRGYAWLSITTQIVFANGTYFEIHNNTKWGSIDRNPEIAMKLLAHFKKAVTDDSSSKNKIILCDTTDDNIGHIIWNDFSGYVELAKILNKQNKKNIIKELIITLPQIQHSFAGKTIKECFLQPLLDILEEYYPKETEKVKVIEEASFNQVTNDQNYTNILAFSNQYISFRYPKMSPLLVKSIGKRYPKKIMPNVINIFLNVRTHNKSQLNIDACLDLFLSLRSQKNNTEVFKKISFKIETVTENELVSAVIAILKKHNIEYSLHLALDVNLLCELISSSDVCIAPIGSGAVLPTWIFDKPTVLHADSAHMNQMEWWHKVGGNTIGHLFPVDRSAIADVGTGSYLNYLVNPNDYADALFLALDAAERVELPPASRTLGL